MARLRLRLGHRLDLNRWLILRAHEPALDAEATVVVDADERAGASDLIWVEFDRTVVVRGERRLDLGETHVDRLREVVPADVALLEPLVLGLKVGLGRFFPGVSGSVFPCKRLKS